MNDLTLKDVYGDELSLVGVVYEGEEPGVHRAYFEATEKDEPSFSTLRTPELRPPRIAELAFDREGVKAIKKWCKEFLKESA